MRNTKIVVYLFLSLVLFVDCTKKSSESLNLESDQVRARIEQIYDNNTVLVRFKFRNQIYKKTLPIEIFRPNHISRGKLRFKVHYDQELKLRKIIYKAQRPHNPEGVDIDLLSNDLNLGQYISPSWESSNSEVKHIAIHVLKYMGKINAGGADTNIDSWELTKSNFTTIKAICNEGINSFLINQVSLGNIVYVHCLDSVRVNNVWHYKLSSASLFDNHFHDQK